MEGTFVDMAERLRELLDALEKLPTVEGEGEKEEENDETATSSAADVAEEEGLTSTERAEALWEEVQEHVENLDYALMFCQVGGLPTLFRFLLQAAAAEEDKEAEARAVPALAVLATLTQNNLPVQEQVLRFSFGEMEKEEKESSSSSSSSSERGRDASQPRLACVHVYLGCLAFAWSFARLDVSTTRPRFCLHPKSVTRTRAVDRGERHRDLLPLPPSLPPRPY